MSEEKNEADYQRGWAAGNEAARDRMAGLEQSAARLALERAEFRRDAETLRAQLAEAHAVVRDLLVVIEQYPSCQRTVIARCRCLSCSIPRAWELLKSDAAQQPAGGAA